MAPHVAVVDLNVVFGLRSTALYLSFEAKVFADFTSSIDESPAMRQIARTLGDECPVDRSVIVCVDSRLALTLHSKACKNTSEGADNRCIRVMASFTLVKYSTARACSPAPISHKSSSDKTVVRNL
jgi:hypothetical protein